MFGIGCFLGAGDEFVFGESVNGSGLVILVGVSFFLALGNWEVEEDAIGWLEEDSELECVWFLGLGMKILMGIDLIWAGEDSGMGWAEQEGDEATMEKILEGGPYFAAQVPLLLKPMPQMFKFDDEVMKCMPVWISLPCLPKECWGKKGLSKIVSQVGKPLRMDGRTSTLNAYSFARALVMVDASEKLLQEVTIRVRGKEPFVQKIDYDYSPKYCVNCKHIGHLTANCHRGIEEKIRVTKSTPNLLPNVFPVQVNGLNAECVANAEMVSNSVVNEEIVVDSVLNVVNACDSPEFNVGADVVADVLDSGVDAVGNMNSVLLTDFSDHAVNVGIINCDIPSCSAQPIPELMPIIILQNSPATATPTPPSNLILAHHYSLPKHPKLSPPPDNTVTSTTNTTINPMPNPPIQNSPTPSPKVSSTASTSQAQSQSTALLPQAKKRHKLATKPTTGSRRITRVKKKSSKAQYLNGGVSFNSNNS